MDHSLYAYLERLSPLKLKTLLQELRTGTYGANYAYMIPLVEEILEKRKDNNS